ncbi:cadherin repeat domain-containing protein, partial [Gammaproteobacteria bacterium]|nr:cadherin repeat domain-containing protein [Gammaproteobacteria bacterium]
YSLTLTASDGTNTISNIINIIVDDVTELSIALASSAISLSETAASGTSVTTTTTTIDGNSTVSYSLSGTGSDQFSVDSSGNITTNGTLDYETTTSYSLTLTASDGTNTVTQNFTVSVTDTNLSLSASLASAAQSEGLSTGTTIATSSNSNAEGSVTYSLTDADNKFSINSSTGEVTLANALDYETKTSHEFTITATDGVTTTSETFTLSVSDLKINTLAVTLSNSGAALAESSSSGTSVGSSSITNPESETVSYILSGTGSSNFAVDSSGNVTTNTTLDFETAKSYSLTLTAAAGGNTTTDTFTVNVGNVEELESAVLRYSADYNSVSRSGFSATATRGPSGSGLPSYTLEQVGTTNSTDITSVDDTSNNYVPVEINSGTALNWRYYFPIDTSGNGQFAFAPNSSALDGKYYSPLGTAVTTTIANADFLTAGRLEGAEYWFMTTDKAVVDISYTSQLGSYTSVTDYTPTWDSSDDLLNGVDNSLNGIEIDWIDGNTVNGDDTRHAYGKVTLPSAFTYYDQSIASLWVFSNGYAQIDTGSNTAFRGSDSYFPFTYSRGQKGYALDTLFADRIWDEDNKPSNIGLSGEALNYSLFPWWNAQVYSGDNSTGTKLYYVDQTASTGLFIIGWYRSYELSMPDNAAYDSNYEIVLDYNTGNIEFRYGSIPAKNDPSNNLAIGLTGDLSLSSACSFQNSTSANSARSCNGAYEAYLFHDYHFSAQDGDEGYGSVDGNGGITFAPASGTQNAAATSTYDLYEDQVTLAGEVYTDANFVSFTDSTKRVIAMAVIPIENFAASGSSNDYFIPNFIPKTLWSYGDVGHNYCLGAGNDASACNTYENYYDFSSIALDSSDMVDTSRFNGSTNELPEGQSMWWQVLNPSGVGVGLWAQISLKDSYDGASGNTTRDDQQSLLNVVISNVDYRKNDTTRYSAGDTGLGMDGYHYWSYQGATNADNDGLGINYGTSPIECATSNDSGCFWGDSSNQPGGVMITSSDPYKSGSMTLGVNYNSNNDTFSTGSFNVSAVVQDVKPSSSSYADYASLSDFRSSDFYSSSATGYSGFFSGILEFNVSGSGNSQLSSIRSSSTLATFTFDTTNDDIQVVAPMTISAAPSNNYTSNWSTVDTGSMTLKFGDATNDETKSTYISSEVFAAEIQDDGAQIDGTSGGSNNLAGVMVSYNTLDKEDTDLFHTGGNWLCLASAIFCYIADLYGSRHRICRTLFNLSHEAKLDQHITKTRCLDGNIEAVFCLSNDCHSSLAHVGFYAANLRSIPNSITDRKFNFSSLCLDAHHF